MAKINAHTTKAEKEAPGYYEAWANKFKPKKTTDDCLTPEPVYQAVLDWARREYDIPETTQIVRPFWPGGDYQAEDYSGDCVVIDNPPFSILSEICRWYQERGVRFFLFAPSTQLFSTASGALHYVVCDKSVTYANGARVNTSFVTNLGDDKIRWSPELRKVIAEAVQLTQATDRKPSPPVLCLPGPCDGHSDRSPSSPDRSGSEDPRRQHLLCPISGCPAGAEKGHVWGRFFDQPSSSGGKSGGGKSSGQADYPLGAVGARAGHHRESI